MTDYIYAVHIAVPESLMDAANAAALVLGENAADGSTFTVADWQKGGVHYAFKSFVVTASFLERIDQPLIAPDHAPDADVPLAQSFMDALVLWQGEGKQPVAQSDKPIAYITGADVAPQGMAAAMGLSLIE
jgi:hypothetical protein